MAHHAMCAYVRPCPCPSDRTHFGAWVITSNPLVLGYDLSDDVINDRVWDFVTNQEAIAINQAWAGHPGACSDFRFAHALFWTCRTFSLLLPSRSRSLAHLPAHTHASTLARTLALAYSWGVCLTRALQASF